MDVSRDTLTCRRISRVDKKAATKVWREQKVARQTFLVGFCHGWDWSCIDFSENFGKETHLMCVGRSLTPLSRPWATPGDRESKGEDTKNHVVGLTVSERQHKNPVQAFGRGDEGFFLFLETRHMAQGSLFGILEVGRRGR